MNRSIAFRGECCACGADGVLVYAGTGVQTVDSQGRPYLPWCAAQQEAEEAAAAGGEEVLWCRCLPCWYDSGDDPSLVLADSVLSLGDTLWADSSHRSILLAVEAVLLAVLSARLGWPGRLGGRRDVATACTTARLLSLTGDLVRHNIAFRLVDPPPSASHPTSLSLPPCSPVCVVSPALSSVEHTLDGGDAWRGGVGVGGGGHRHRYCYWTAASGGDRTAMGPTGGAAPIQRLPSYHRLFLGFLCGHLEAHDFYDGGRSAQTPVPAYASNQRELRRLTRWMAPLNLSEECEGNGEEEEEDERLLQPAFSFGPGPIASTTTTTAPRLHFAPPTATPGSGSSTAVAVQEGGAPSPSYRLDSLRHTTEQSYARYFRTTCVPSSIELICEEHTANIYPPELNDPAEFKVLYRDVHYQLCFRRPRRTLCSCEEWNALRCARAVHPTVADTVDLEVLNMWLLRFDSVNALKPLTHLDTESYSATAALLRAISSPAVLASEEFKQFRRATVREGIDHRTVRSIQYSQRDFAVFFLK